MSNSYPFVATAALAAVIGFVAPAAQATLIASDSFANSAAADTYNADRLFGQNPTASLSGFTGAWGNTTNQSTSDLQAQAGSITTALTPGTTADGRLSTNGAASDRSVFRELSSVPASSTYAFSFAMQGGGISTANVAGFGLATNQGVGTVPSTSTGVLVGIDANAATLWVDGSASVLLPSADFGVDTPYFVLVEIANNAGTDSITASIFSAAATDLVSPLASVTATGKISADLTHLALVKDFHIESGLKVDEFRFGTTAADVTVIPEPASLVLLALGGTCCLVRRRSQA